MPDQPPNFAIPGLMHIDRPRLDRQRAILRLPTKRIGDTIWNGIPSVGPVRPGGTQPAYALAKVRLIFGISSPAPESSVFICSSQPQAGEGTVAIANSTTWTFSIPPQPLPLDLGDYVWEIHTTDTAGRNTVYYAGRQLIAP
jgi:hypothetical protein